jgi:hypothetical protein
MSMNKKIVLTAAVGIALCASSCRKMLDVNNNPNVSPITTIKALLPAGQLYLGTAVGTDMEVYGSIWSQYWTQAPQGKQYIPVEQFVPTQSAFNQSWANLYAAAENFYQVGKLADSQGKKPYKAIALLMQAYTFQLLADGWGDVPFSQALAGQFSTGNLMNPAYDSQRSVYHGIIDYIDTATNIINRSGSASQPGSDDLIYHGDMQKWKKFANTLKLKALLRLAYKDSAYAHRNIDSLFKYNPSFIGMGDDARIEYGSGPTNGNPLFAELNGISSNVQQLAGSSTVIDSLNSNNDYRVSVFYTRTTGGTYAGISQSKYDFPMGVGAFSIPSATVGADIADQRSANAPVHLLTSWESYFLQAEAVARGWVTTGSDASLFLSGVQASFNYYSSQILAERGVTGAAAYSIYVNGDVVNTIPAAYWSAYPATGTVAQKLRYIITQKWFAMAGNQGFEAWTEWRRTGYPDFLVNPTNSAIGAARPQRFLYPTTEAATNSSYPGLMPITSLVWWDKF